MRNEKTVLAAALLLVALSVRPRAAQSAAPGAQRKGARLLFPGPGSGAATGPYDGKGRKLAYLKVEVLP